MTCTVNGKQVSEGNVADMDWTFAEIIERCSYGATVFREMLSAAVQWVRVAF